MDSVLEYARPGVQRRWSRLALFSLFWTLVVPGLALILIALAGDTIDEIQPRPLLFLVFQVLATAAPLAGVVMGGIAIGRVRARRDELRGQWFAIAAVGLGCVQTVVLGWLCGEASTWG